MKTRFRGLALAATLLTSSSIAMADQNANSAVGDLPGYGEDAYFDEEAAYVDENVAPASHAESAMHYQPTHSPHMYQQEASVAPVSQIQPAGFHNSCGWCGSCL